MSQYRKSVAAIVGAILTWGYTAQVDGISSAEWWGLAIGVATAAGVYKAPNTGGDDRGASELVWLLLGFVIGLLVYAVFKVR